MKKLYIFFTILLFTTNSKSQIVNIPDANFKAKLLEADTNNLIAMNLSYTYFKIDANNDGEIQVSEASQVSSLALDNSGISNLTGINFFPNIYLLSCSNNQLTTLDLSNNTNIYYLYCDFNQLTNLNVTGLTNLTWLYCHYNNLTSLNITPTNSLQKLKCYNNQISTLNVTGFPALSELNCRNNSLSSINIGTLTNLQVLDVSNNNLSTLPITNLINLTELNFESNFVSNIDTTNLTLLNSLICANNQITTLNLNNLPALTILNCSNNLLTSLNLSPLNNLVYLTCNSNNLGTLNISGLTMLQNVSAVGCNLTQFTSNQHPVLNTLILYDNLLTTLSINNLTSLNFLGIGKNNFTSLNIDSLVNLTTFECYLCEQLNTVSFQNNVNLDAVTINFTNLTSLDFSSLTNNLNQQLAVNDNPLLNSINVKNGVSEANFNFSNCPNLVFICADENEIPIIQNYITGNGQTNCQVSSYCSFTPGGTFYTIQGNAKYDSNNNGCNVSDLNCSNLKFNVTSGVNTGSFFANVNGSFSLPVSAGYHTFSPVFEDPTYFNISPTSTSVTFPATVSSFVQDFCVTANGTHNDLEATLLSIGPARPGFDANYKIVYKNKGTAMQSGTVNLTFDDTVVDLMVSNPIVNSQSNNNLAWNFSNLQPFETREITLTLNVNSPMETPAVNSGDILNYTATITGVTDETPTDNASTLNQTVVNSYDPNDKTCVEGTTITPSMVGQYVHYIIRFENTGTFAAENIVIADIIDSAKFDLSTLIPQSSSHSFVTRINNTTNKVEFIFENINLPFDDGNNDGYVAFKIKTKPTLVVGDTFSNTANIYFDYNFPITTNTYVTTVQTLGHQDFEFSSVFSLSPVPTKEVLTITAKESVVMTSVSIYNTLGQLVQVHTNPNESIDISGLSSGNYFIKVISDKGSSTGKFIKE